MSIDGARSCRKEGCEEPRYGTLAICRTHNNERQRELYAARKAMSPPREPVVREKKTLCKDCVDEGMEEPRPRLPFQSYCQPHRTKRAKVRYQLNAANSKVELTQLTEQQRHDALTALAEEAQRYEYEWEQGMHRTHPSEQDSESAYLRKLREDVK